MYARAASAYRNVDLTTLSKGDVVARLFDRFLADAAAARAAIMARDIPAKAVQIDHAMQIVGALRAGLDDTAAPELVERLDSLYEFVHTQLGLASLKLAVEPLDAAVSVMTTLGEAFQQIRATP